MKTALGIGLVLTLSGCATLRDVRLDHQLPRAETPALDLSAYKSVQERADGQDPDLAVAAAMSGGGHRAGNFAMGVLLALESFDTGVGPYDLLREIDYLTPGPPKEPQERHHGESKQEGVETRGPDPPPHSSQERT